MSDTGYIYAVICAIMMVMQSMVAGACIERLLTGRDDRISKRKRSVLWFVLCWALTGMKCLFPVPDIILSVGTPLAMSLWYILFLKYCYSDKARVKFTHAAMLVLQNIMADVIYELVRGVPNVEIWHFPFAVRGMAEACTVVAALSIMMNIIYTSIVLRMRKKKKVKTSPMWITIMLLLMLIFMAIQAIHTSETSVNSYFTFICIFTVMEFSILMLYLSQSEKQEAQEEKQKVQEEVCKLQQAMELEKIHYEQVEARREEMAKIRHDYNNVITSVMFLIENGRTDEAGDMIKDLSERISKTQE